MRTLLVAAFAAAALFAPAANAEQVQQSVTIRVADLDMSRADGVRLFDRRLWQAAREACALDGPLTLAAQSRRLACEQGVIAQGNAERDRRVAAARAAAPAVVATR
jgi:UrcA family protein